MITNLPLDSLYKILSFLDPPDLYAFMRVNKAFKRCIFPISISKTGQAALGHPGFRTLTIRLIAHLAVVNVHRVFQNKLCGHSFQFLLHEIAPALEHEITIFQPTPTSCQLCGTLKQAELLLQHVGPIDNIFKATALKAIFKVRKFRGLVAQTLATKWYVYEPVYITEKRSDQEVHYNSKARSDEVVEAFNKTIQKNKNSSVPTLDSSLKRIKTLENIENPPSSPSPSPVPSPKSEKFCSLGE